MIPTSHSFQGEAFFRGDCFSINNLNFTSSLLKKEINQKCNIAYIFGVESNVRVILSKEFYLFCGVQNYPI